MEEAEEISIDLEREFQVVFGDDGAVLRQRKGMRGVGIECLRGNHDENPDGRFGGGGHLKAAGCTIKSPLASAKRKMRAAVKEILKSRNSKTAKIADLKLP